MPIELLAELVSKLNDQCRNTLQSAAALCMTRTNSVVEIEHWLFELVKAPDNDVKRIAQVFGINDQQWARELNLVIDGFRTGNDRSPTISRSIDRLIRQAWVINSLKLGSGKIRSGSLILAMFDDDELRRILQDSKEFKKIQPDRLLKEFATIVGDSPESNAAVQQEEPAQSGKPGPGQKVHSEALDLYTINLTQLARDGRLDPVSGRDDEIRQMIDILIRRRQNNPILTGEAGVGKTAVVEGLALKIAEDDVPEVLKNVEIRTLDLGLLQAGAGVKGEFENRLKQIINEVKASPTPLIIFIDEAHTLIGAGGAAGQGDAANLLKPALARGELRTIAATTWAEYKKYFEKDAALTRRFQVVKVEEPTEDSAVRMVRGLADKLEQHHKVTILDEAIESCVKLSHRYLTSRQLPDKAVSLLDTACARVAIGQRARPSIIETLRQRLRHVEIETRIITRENASMGDKTVRLAELDKEKTETETELKALEERWNVESKLVSEILDQLRVVQNPPADSSDTTIEAARQKLRDQLSRLREVQGETPLIQPQVDSQTVAEVVAGWTGIPVGRMLTDEIQKVMTLKEQLEKRVLGQSHALEMIAQRIRTSRAGLADPKRPIAVFMLVGPSGVGKTETALALSEALYGGEHNLVTINMTEYQEKHTVSSLKGSPPGYVGYGEGGVLTEAIRRKPYSVLLLDEVEKAHPDVLELFFQVFDKGMLEDGEGRVIDFKNTVILLTSNVGTDTIMDLCHQEGGPPDPITMQDMVRPDLLEATKSDGTIVFKQAFLGRLVTIPYYAISDEVMKKIIQLQLNRFANRLRDGHNAVLEYPETLIDNIAARCTEVDSGARNVDHILTRTIMPAVSEQVLSHMAKGSPIKSVKIGVDETGELSYEVN
ncbi:type VI secretion system ATPase TssH [bacterium]|nr:type VI secretion system ATPase TssH [bacterium]